MRSSDVGHVTKVRPFFDQIAVGIGLLGGEMAARGIKGRLAGTGLMDMEGMHPRR